MSDFPKIGISTIVRREGKILLHKRLSSHAYGKWSPPGGHLEMFEGLVHCAVREMQEEAGPLVTTQPEFWTVTNTMYREENKHYVVLFFVCDWISGEAQVMEPQKCEVWGWYSWDELPAPLIIGMQYLKDNDLNPHEFKQRRTANSGNAG